MANSLEFEDILKLVKENNPRILEEWKDRKISGAKTLFNSNYKRKVIDEVRFKIKGGAQISFIGDDDQEKLVKITGGREKAQRTLDYLNKYNEEHQNELAEVDVLAASIVTVSLEKYIRILEEKQKEREAKKVKLPTIDEMKSKLDEIDSKESEDKAKLKEKEEYMKSMKEMYQREFDILKHKLEGIRLKINDKKIITIKGEDGTEVKNFSSINKLYERFQTLKNSVYDCGQIVSFIDESIASIKEDIAKINNPIKEQMDLDSQEEVPENKQNKDKKSIFVFPEDDVIEDDDLDEDRQKKDDEDESKLPPKVSVYDFNKPRGKFKPLKIYGDIAYNYGSLRQKIYMKRLALEMDLEDGKIKDSLLMRFAPFRALRSILPSRKLKESAMDKLESEDIMLGELYEIHEAGEIRFLCQRRQDKLEKRDALLNRDSYVEDEEKVDPKVEEEKSKQDELFRHIEEAVRRNIEEEYSAESNKRNNIDREIEF